MTDDAALPEPVRTLAELVRDPTYRAWRLAEQGRFAYFGDVDQTYRIDDDGSLTLQPADPARELEHNVGCAVCNTYHAWMGECPIAAVNPAVCTTCKARYFTAAAIVAHIQQGNCSGI